MSARPRPRRIRPLALLALCCAAGAIWLWAAPSGAPARGSGQPAQRLAPPEATRVAQGRQLFVGGCSSCHGTDARGITGRAPSLYGVGAAAADFYLSTGRMPLASPSDAPKRTDPAYSRSEIDALVAYVGGLGTGPAIPRVDAAAGSLSDGKHLFTLSCAGCHQEIGAGGIATGAVAPPLDQATPTQVGEAIRVGPYLMPVFSKQTISDRQVASIARYVDSIKSPDDFGGWGIGHLGPIPEGMVAWGLALVALLIVARILGERTPT